MLERCAAGLVLVAAVLGAAACSHALPRAAAASPPPAATHAQIGAWGLDLTAATAA